MPKQKVKIIPINNFILLSLITFGIYELVWFYRGWKLLKNKKKMNINPFWRAFFSPFYAGDFAKNFQEFLKDKDLKIEKSDSKNIGMIYFILSILYILPNPFWMISFFTFIPLLPLVKNMNRFYKVENPKLKPKKFNWLQKILVVIGVVFLIIIFFGNLS
ncbi:MAG: DUF4234 domain-containing protein [Candidatus Magasanikbacteria bacterium]|nr:DUF4234 domain-containing protein [Candidatus Magasanikbacteria bacterium]